MSVFHLRFARRPMMPVMRMVGTKTTTAMVALVAASGPLSFTTARSLTSMSLHTRSTAASLAALLAGRGSAIPLNLSSACRVRLGYACMIALLERNLAPFQTSRDGRQNITFLCRFRHLDSQCTPTRITKTTSASSGAGLVDRRHFDARLESSHGGRRRRHAARRYPTDRPRRNDHLHITIAEPKII
jgi:hypothetical protein